MGAFHLKPSFAGGELTPSLYGRIDLQKYDVGAATLENAIVQRYGGVTRRPGFIHIGQTKNNNPARLIPFSYNAEQNYVLEFTNCKVRVLQDGEFVMRSGFPIEIDTPYTTEDLPQIKYTQSADMLFIAHPRHHPAVITRTVDGWEWRDLSYQRSEETNVVEVDVHGYWHLTDIYDRFFAPNFYIYNCPDGTNEAFWPPFPVSRTGKAIAGTGMIPGTVTPISDTIFSADMQDLWVRCDCYYSRGSTGTAAPPVADNGPMCIAAYMDVNASGGTPGMMEIVGLFNESACYVKDTEGTKANVMEPLSQILYEHVITKIVVHISTDGLWIFYNDQIVFSYAGKQGNRINSLVFRPGRGWLSNMIIADEDCSGLTAEVDEQPSVVTRTVVAVEEEGIKNGPFDNPNTTDITVKVDRTKSPTETAAYTNSSHKLFQVSYVGTPMAGFHITRPGITSYLYGQSQASYTNAQKIGIPDNATEVWMRADVYFNYPGAHPHEEDPREIDPLYPNLGCMLCEFDHNSKGVGFGYGKGYYINSAGVRCDETMDYTFIGDTTSGDSSVDKLIKLVVHVSRSLVEIYIDDVLIYTHASNNGEFITGFYTASGQSGGPSTYWSNIIFSNVDCSQASQETGGQSIDVEDGKVLVTASDALFEDDMIGQLLRLTHTVPAQYAKGVPTPHGEGLIISCVPGASVYVESFGFWNGTFEVWEKDDLGQWILLRKQSGNRSSNYNMTFQNDDEVIRWYGVASNNDFDNTEKEGEDPDQRGYITIQSFSNDYDGIVRITDIISPTQAKAVVIRELASTDETLDWAFQAWSKKKGYPAAVGFFEDRLVFAGSPKHPQTYWTSRTGSYLDFGISYPQKDDDAITGTLATGQMNGIKAIVPFDEMIMLTTGGEYRVGGGGQNFTPTTQQARAQEYRGINDVMPVVIGGRIIYSQFHGSVIRDLAYSYDVDKYNSSDVSLLAFHLFDGHTIVSMTYQQTPDSVVWCVRSDGTLLGMTYIKEQDVYAWHKHTTQGEFIDVCSIPGEVEDELYAVVKRGNNYYIERMARRDENVYVDAASLNGSGWWLSGETLQTVGSVAGLGYDTTITMLPLEINASDGTTGSRKKRIQRMCIMFRGTQGGKFGFEGYSLDPIKYEGTGLFDGKKFVSLPHANYEETLMLKVKQDSPYPMTILSIIPEVLQGG